MTEARIARVAEALELIVQARLKRAPTQLELRDEAKELLTAYLASRAERASREGQSKANTRTYPRVAVELDSCNQPAPQSEAGRAGNTPQHTSRDLTGCGRDRDSGPR